MAQLQNGRIIEVTEVDNDDDELRPKTTAEHALADMLDNFKTSNSDATIQIQYVGSGGPNDLRHCETVPADKFTYDELCSYIMKTWGGGDYRLHVRKPGRRGILENKLLKLNTPKNATGLVPMNNAGDMAGAVQTIGNMMAENQRQMMAVMERMSQRPDPKAELLAQLDMMRAMREAMGLPAPSGTGTVSGAPKSALESIQEFAQTMVAMKSLSGDMSGIFGGAGEAAEKHWIERIVENHGESLIGLGQAALSSLSQNKAIEATADMVREVKPAETVRQNPAPRQAPVIPAPVLALLKRLHTLAEDDADTDVTAEQLLSDSKTKAFLENVSKQERPLKMLAKFFPPIMDNLEWWVDLVACIQERLTPPDDAGQDSAQDQQEQAAQHDARNTGPIYQNTQRDERDGGHGADDAGADSGG